MKLNIIRNSDIFLKQMAEEISLIDCPILYLPLDIVISICEFLEDKDILRLGQTCTTFYEVTHHSIIWRFLSLNRWGFCNLKATPSCQHRWKTYYSHRRGVEVKMDAGKSGNYQVRTLRGHDDVISDSMYVSLGGEVEIDEFKPSNVVSASLDGSVRLWDVESKKCISLYKDAPPIKSIAAFPNSAVLIAGDGEGRLIQFKMPSLEIVKCLETNNPIISVQYFKSCYKGGVDWFISSHQDGSMLFWKDFENSENVDPFRTLHTGGYYPNAVNKEIKLSVLGDQSKAVLLAHNKDDMDVLDFAKLGSDCSDADCLITRLQFTDRLIDAGWVKGSKTPFFVCVEYSQICLFEVDNSKSPLTQWINPTDTFQVLGSSCLSMGPGLNFVVGLQSGEVHHYTIDAKSTIQLVIKFYNHTHVVHAVFATGYRVMSCSSDFSIRVYVWGKEGGKRVLESKYTLLGGSLALNPNPLFTRVVHDDVSCVGTNGKLLKVYVFQQ